MNRFRFAASLLAILCAPLSVLGQTTPAEAPAVPAQQELPPPIVTATQGVAGEPRPERPYRGLFGGAGVPTPGLFLLFNGYAGRDSNVLADQPGRSGTQPYSGVAGGFGGGSGELNYLMVRGDTEFSLMGRTDARYYPAFEGDLTHSHNAAAALDFVIGRDLHVSVRQGFEYASFFQLAVGPRTGIAAGFGEPIRLSADQALEGGSTIGYDSALEVVHPVGPRGQMEYAYRFRRTEFNVESRTFTLQGAGASYRRNMTRYAALRLGYGYTQSNTGVREPVHMHNLDTGIDYARPLSFSRRTQVGFTVGSQAFDRDDRMLYRFQGTGRITHEMGRTWLLVGAYDRGAQFVETLDEPLYANTVAVSLGGFMAGGRLQLTTHGSYSDGELTLTTRSRGLKIYSGAAGLLWALGTKWAVRGDYGYHFYEFGPGVAIPGELTDRFVRRHSLTVGLQLWLPLLTQRGLRGTR